MLLQWTKLASTPPPRRWPWRGTPPKHSNERRRSGASSTRRRRCRQKHRVAQSGPASVETTCLVGVSVDELQRRAAVKKQVLIKGALEVSKDALRNREMGLTGGRACEGTPSELSRRYQA
jgi:hypothetical protein